MIYFFIISIVILSTTCIFLFLQYKKSIFQYTTQINKLEEQILHLPKKYAAMFSSDLKEALIHEIDLSIDFQHSIQTQLQEDLLEQNTIKHISNYCHSMLSYYQCFPNSKNYFLIHFKKKFPMFFHTFSPHISLSFSGSTDGFLVNYNILKMLSFIFENIVFSSENFIFHCHIHFNAGIDAEISFQHNQSLNLDKLLDNDQSKKLLHYAYILSKYNGEHHFEFFDEMYTEKIIMKFDKNGRN